MEARDARLLGVVKILYEKAELTLFTFSIKNGCLRNDVNKWV